MRRLSYSLLAVALASCRSSSAPAQADAGGDVADVADGGDDACKVTAPAPRPIAPVSVSRLTSRRPTFRWKLSPGSDGARVEVCADRACTLLVASFDAAGDHATPAQELPPGVVFWRLRPMAGGAVGAATSATWEAVVPARSSPVAAAWGAMLDANGDGFGDIVVGDSDAFTPTEHVYVHLGGPSGPSATPSSVLTAPAPVIRYAASIASAGDVDGDGFGDLLVGSPRADAVYFYRGGPAGFADPAAAVFHGPAMSGFGGAVSGAGDVDGDGYADVVVGMPLRAPSSGSKVTGAVVVLFGAAGGLSASRTAALLPAAGSDAQGFGQYVATAGDVDGDGLADVAVWGGVESSDPQKVALYLGRGQPFGAAPSVLLQYEGSTADWLGNANLLACAGDTNGDGYTDIAVSTPAGPTVYWETDHVSLFYGGPSGPAEIPSRRIVSPLAAGDHFGLTVAALDVDGDGTDDLGVSSVSYASQHVAALVYRGGPAGPSLATRFTTTDPTSEFDREIGGPGDVDGDGFADWVVGFPARATPVGDGGTLTGAVEVHRGGPAGAAVLPAWTLLPPDASAVAYGGSLAPP